MFCLFYIFHTQLSILLKKQIKSEWEKKRWFLLFHSQLFRLAGRYLKSSSSGQSFTSLRYALALSGGNKDNLFFEAILYITEGSQHQASKGPVFSCFLHYLEELKIHLTNQGKLGIKTCASQFSFYRNIASKNIVRDILPKKELSRSARPKTCLYCSSSWVLFCMSEFN